MATATHAVIIRVSDLQDVKSDAENQLKDGKTTNTTHIASHLNCLLIKPKTLSVHNLQITCFRYHVPRSWLKPAMNRLVIFEELGGDPSMIKLVRRSVSTVCASVYENHAVIKNWEIESYGKPQARLSPKARLRCPAGQYISAINFVSYGTPTGTCGNFMLGKCHAQNSESLITKVTDNKFTCIKFNVLMLVLFFVLATEMCWTRVMFCGDIG